MGKTTAKKPAGKKMPFGTTKGAFGKEGKGAKGSKGGRPLAKWCALHPRTFSLLSIRPSRARPTPSFSSLTLLISTHAQDCGQERTKRGGEAVFDDSVRRDWVTGYSKRKTARRKFAVKQAEEKARKERLQERKERREEMKHKLGLDRPEEPKEEVVGTVETETTEYGNGVVVTVEGLD